ncbi:MAG: hypothetical protein WB425_08480 [Terracidiphilus sp.]
MDDMNVGLIRYDAARKALTAAHRIDEVKKIHDKATALLAYARQAGDLHLQNMAAEIRLVAERRAGQLLVDMHETGQRQTKERGRPQKVSSPTTLSKLGLSRDQSSKWQRLARTIDDATFEEALSKAKDRFGELTTAGVLRMVKEVMKPAGTVVEPNPSVLAEALLRDIESASRTEHLAEAVSNREHLNITLRKKLILAVKHAAKEYTKYGEQLSEGFKGFENTGKAYQRVVRENAEKIPDPDIEEKRRLAADLKSATVREISYEEAKSVIVANEWLASMGTTEFSFGLFFGDYLGAVVCLGSTAGTNVSSSVCGVEHKHKVAVICRGASLSWSHKHSGSFIVSAACREMTKKGYNIFVAYSDPDAGEIGTIYSSCNFLYCSMTNPTEQYRTPDGKVHDSRQVSGLARDRTGGVLKFKRTRAEQKAILIEQGCEFYEGTPKHRYVGIFGDRRQKRILRAALRWPVLPYPKRQQPTDVPPHTDGLMPPAILTVESRSRLVSNR